MPRSIQLAIAGLLPLVCLALPGCGDDGPQKYPVSGVVTYGGKPIVYGDIRFEPKEGLNNQQTMAITHIEDGKYKTEVVGGPHWVYVRDLTGDADMGNPDKPGRSKFLMEYRGALELPRVEEVTSDWISFGLGSENNAMPTFVALGGRDGRLLRNGFLPGEHQGMVIDTQSNTPAEMIPNLTNGRLQREHQSRQLQFLQQLNRDHLAEQGGFDPLLEARIRSMETAFRMQFVAAEVCDIRRETAETIKSYGETNFGRVCLLTRRMVEHGVRFIHVENGGWDHHTNINRNIAGSCRTIDRPIAALIEDLKQRGLLDETLIVWGGEFGRTPVSESEDGRDHNSYGFTMWMAGGGVRGGMSYGSTDEFGFQAVENRVAIHDLHATILYLLGIDHERLTYRYSGRDFRLTDVHGRVLHDLIA